MLGSLLTRRTANLEQRSTPVGMSFADYVRLFETTFRFGGGTYSVTAANLEQAAEEAYERNGPVAALIAVRTLVFSEVLFTWQRLNNGRPSSLFGTPELSILETPWPGATTGDLLARMELDGSIYGNSYWVRSGDDLARLDPTKVVVISGTYRDPNDNRPVAPKLVAYAYQANRGEPAVTYLASEVAHYRPLPSNRTPFVGQSWIGSVIPEITSDNQLTTFKSAFLRNGAVPNLVVTFDPGVTPDQFNAFKSSMDAGHVGAANAFKTLYIGGGADAKVVGANFEDLALKATQGAGETRLAAAAGVPASIVGFSEGLAGSALNAGNYAAARRRFADGTIRPLWRSACSALATLVTAPGPDVRLWYSDAGVSFIQEDAADDASIRQVQASTIKTLIDAGYQPDAVIEAVTTGDFAALNGQHSGLFSVQLQPAGTTALTDAEEEGAGG